MAVMAAVKRADAVAAVRDRARVVLWGVGIVGAAQVAAAYLSQNHTGAVIAQVVIAEFGTGHVGVAWSDPLAPMPTASAIGQRAFRGASLGAAAAVVLVGAFVLFHVATLTVGTLSVASLIIGLLVSACTAVRDELLLRGLMLRSLGPRTHVAVQLVVCGVAGAAYRFGTDASASKLSLAFAFLLSVALGALWLRDRGAWIAVAANATYMFITGPIVHGALLDVRGELEASWVACACGAAFAASAIVILGRQFKWSLK